MQLSQSFKPHNQVDYYPLPNGYADVFLHRNEETEKDDDDNTIYIAEEVYFQVAQSVTKEDIEENFDYMWNDAEVITKEPSAEERLEALERAMLDLILGGGISG